MLVNFDTTDTFITHEEYADAKYKTEINRQAAKAFLELNKRNWMTVEESKALPFASEATNELKGKVEKYTFLLEQPDKYTLYMYEEKKTVGVWTGLDLGKVTFQGKYKSNFGDIRVKFVMRAYNGLMYHGTYFKSSGQLASIRKYKNQNLGN